MNKLPPLLCALKLVHNKIVILVWAGNGVSARALGVRHWFFRGKALLSIGVLIKDLSKASAQFCTVRNGPNAIGHSNRKS